MTAPNYQSSDVCPLLNKSRKAGIDLGINNLIALATDQHDIRPALVNGRPLKSLNAYYNKRIAKFRSLKKYSHINAVCHKRNIEDLVLVVHASLVK